jgi:ketosteroid isomerase-like protein
MADPSPPDPPPRHYLDQPPEKPKDSAMTTAQHDPHATAAEQAEDEYFGALVAGDADRIDNLLTDDFVIVDINSGAVADRAAFIAAIRDGLLVFERVHLVERLTRRHSDTTMIVGRTEMSGSFGQAPFAAASRYTHVLLRDEADGRWRLATAQGTRIVGP